MSVNYDLYRIKDLGKEEHQGLLRARFVSKDTIGTEKLIHWIHETSGFNHGEVKGMITCLCEGILQYLENGHNVQLDDLGYFTLSLSSHPVKDKKDIRAESVGFRKLLFRSSRKAHKRLKNVVTRRVVYSTAGAVAIHPDKKAILLQNYLKENPCATRADYARITSTLKSNAIRDLNEFIRQGWLRKYGSGRTIVYLLNDAN